MKNNKGKKIKFDAEAGVFVQTEEIIIGAKSNGARVLKNNLKLELVQIVEQVKKLKARADEIKEMLKLIDESEKEGPIKGPSSDFNPDLGPGQFSVQ